VEFSGLLAEELGRGTGLDSNDRRGRSTCCGERFSLSRRIRPAAEMRQVGECSDLPFLDIENDEKVTKFLISEEHRMGNRLPVSIRIVSIDRNVYPSIYGMTCL
jgi:hypothetical protein